MTFKFDNVYLQDTATIAGPYEREGPLKQYFDKTYKDLYFGEASFELAEIKLVKDALVMLMKKTSLTKGDIDVVVGGDLLNQITATTYGACNVGKSFVGIYGACSSSVLGMIIATIFLDSKRVNNAITVVSSHNMSSEKQFRNPTEYGAPKPDSATFTATGAAACLLTVKKNDVKVECATLGKIIDLEQNDPNDMGKVMAPAAIDTLNTHFKETGRSPKDYDLIVTGDLGRFGKEIVKDYMLNTYNVDLNDSYYDLILSGDLGYVGKDIAIDLANTQGYNIKSNYNDCGVMLYDLALQKEEKAGGSGPACSALVSFSYIYNMLKEKKLKKVLIIATGALFSPTLVYQKENIYSIAHAISLEVV